MCDLDNTCNEFHYVSNQKSNSYNKAIEHLSLLQHRIDQLSSEIQTAMSRHLDHIIMVNIDEELSPIIRDEVEER